MAKRMPSVSEVRFQMKKYFGAIIVALGVLALTGCAMYGSNPYGGPYDQPQGPYDQPQEPYGQPEEPYNPGYGYGSGANIDQSYFYDYLSDYGQWVYYPGYNYVWIPAHMASGWRPYSYGRWVWTEYGWTWVSYFRWGWIPFHYGRWVFEPGFGWFWIPDTVWGPAWVSWRYSGSHIGWAPLPPHYRYHHGRGLFLTSIDLPDECWVFVDSRHFDAHDVRGYVLPWNRNREFIRTTVARTQLEERGGRIINNGLDLNEAERITRHKFSKYAVQDSNKAGAERLSSGRVVIYKPNVTAKGSAAPRKFVKKEEADKARKSGAVRKVKKDEQASTGYLTSPLSNVSANGGSSREVRTWAQSGKSYVAPKAEEPRGTSSFKSEASKPRQSDRIVDSTNRSFVAPKTDRSQRLVGTERGNSASFRSTVVRETSKVENGASRKSDTVDRKASVKEVKSRTETKSSSNDRKANNDSGRAKAKGRNAK